MKKLGLTLVMAMMAVMLVAGGAWALPLDSNGNVIANTDGYSWVDNPYWTITDLTTGEEGSAYFILTVEQAAYESDFGLFTVDDYQSPSAIDQELEIFQATEEPSLDPLSAKSVYFKNENGAWDVSFDETTWVSFNNIFGYYYGIHTTAGAYYKYYSDAAFNTVDAGDQHVAVEWNGIEDVKIYLEDLRTASADWDWSDMTVVGHDVAPVPEPGTMALLGIGLLGLAFVGRKKLKIED